MLDDRVEVFLLQEVPGVPFQSYWAFEINKAGRALTNINQSVTERGGRTTFDREWDGRPALDASLLPDGRTMLVTLYWSELGVRPGTSSLCRSLSRRQAGRGRQENQRWHKLDRRGTGHFDASRAGHYAARHSPRVSGGGGDERRC